MTINLETVWREYRSSIKRFLHSKINDDDEVDELLQQILIKTYENLDTVKSHSKIKSWLFQIANHAIIDFYRARAKRQSLTEQDLWYQQEAPNVKENLSACIAPFIDALPQEQRQLLTDIEVNGQSQKAYAKQHQIPYSTLKSRVTKARSLLKSQFENCCSFELDAQGNLHEYHQKSKGCGDC